MRTWLPLVLVLAACDGEEGTTRPIPLPADQQRALEAENQRAMRIEDRDIVNYVARHHLDVHSSGTGVRWQLVRDVAGNNARAGQLVKVNYRVELIDGRKCYASVPGEPESFRVEHDDVESGLHEAVQYLSPGDSAIVIIPSHRAFGLIGDRNMIPMRSTVIYYLGLVDARTP